MPVEEGGSAMGSCISRDTGNFCALNLDGTMGIRLVLGLKALGARCLGLGNRGFAVGR